MAGFLGIPSEQQLNRLDACYNNACKTEAKNKRDGWHHYVKHMWRTAPKNIYYCQSTGFVEPRLCGT
eukprot:2641053-Amphidinium_carterae.1